MNNEQGEKLAEHELLKSGLEKLDDALSFFMEMESASGQVVAHFLHAALTIGEQILEAHCSAQANVDAQ